jgi:hypothetical protein
LSHFAIISAFPAARLRIQPCIRALALLRKPLPVNVIQENGLAPIPRADDMIGGTGKLDS